MRLFPSTFMLVSFMAACGGGGSGGGGDGGGGGGGGSADADVACVTPTAITATPSMATVDDEVDPGSGSDPGAQSIDYAATLDAATAIEILLATHTSDYPGGTISPGSKSLAGDDAQFATCGTCVLVFGGIGSDGTATEVYLGTAGTVAITSTTTNFTGSLSNIVLTEVDVDSETNMSTASADGCTSGIANMSFTVPITVDNGSDVDVRPERFQLSAAAHQKLRRN